MRISPAEIVNLIRENLNDRYPFLDDGLTIVKEVIQNADDADARRLDFAWVRRLPEARHELLKGPLLVIRNDGPFSEEQRRAMNSMARSSKTDARASIGKFGLGLKSVFHLCEAFFCFYWPSEGQVWKDLINPWAESDSNVDSLHPSWHEITDSDAQCLRSTLAVATDTDMRFCLCIPLRREEHCRVRAGGRKPIMTGLFGDDDRPLQMLTDEGRPAELSQLLPLLHRLVEVNAWALLSGGRVDHYFRVRLGEGATRRGYPDDKCRNKSNAFGGSCEVQIPVTNASYSLRFAGMERLWDDRVLRRVKDSEYWPTQTSTDERTGEYVSSPDRAEPHCVVCFQQQAEDQGGGLTIRRAVFLPVDTLDKVSGPPPMIGSAGVDLLLHSFSFVDAGRKRIEGWEGDPNEPVVDDQSLRRVWNARLGLLGMLPLVIPTLSQFVKHAELADERIMELTSALARSRLLQPHYRQYVCSEDQWIRRLTSRGWMWSVVGASDQILAVPSMGHRPDEIPLEVFPGLKAICDDHNVTREETPGLTASQGTAPWPQRLLTAVLGSVPTASLSDPRMFDYFCHFVSQNREQILESRALKDQLRELMRRAFRALGLAALRELKRSISSALSAIAPGGYCLVSVETADDQSVLSRLWEETLPALIVPTDLAGDARLNAVPLSVETGSALLLAFAKVAATDKVASGPTAARFVRGVLSSCGPSKEAVLQRCWRTQIVRGRAVGQGEHALYSLDFLKRAQDRGLLFTNWPGLSEQLAGALAAQDVVLVDHDLAAAIYGDGLLAPCTTAACIQVLLRKPNLAAEPEARLPLLGRLVNEGANPHYRDALRYLLHGNRTDDGSLLVVGDDGVRQNVWAKLTAQILSLSSRQWCVVSPTLADTLSPQLRDSLGLATPDSASVQQMLAQVDPSTVRIEELTEEERRELTDQLPPEWAKKLRIHWTSDGHRLVAVGADTYLDNPYALALGSRLRGKLTIIRPQTDHYLLARQRELVPALGAELALGLALRQARPEEHWQAVMEILALSGPEDLGVETKATLRSTAWLPTQSGSAVCPSDVLRIPGLERDLALRLRQRRTGFQDADSLAPELRAHSAYGRLVHLLPRLTDALTMLAEVMSEHGDSALGAIAGDGFGEDDLRACLDSFAASPEALLPSWSVVRRACEATSLSDCLTYLLPSLWGDLKGATSVAVLNYLDAAHERSARDRKDALLRTHSLYLRAAARLPDFGVAILPNIRLRSSAGEWKTPNRLCAFSGIDPSDVLDDQQARMILSFLPRKASPDSASSTQPRPVPTQPVDERALSDSIDRLKSYFANWEGSGVSHPLVGGFLCLLGDYPQMQALARSYLGRWDMDIARGLFEWRPIPSGITGAGETRDAMVGRQRFTVEIVTPVATALQVRNLLGQPFQAKLLDATAMSSLILSERYQDFAPSVDREGFQTNRLRLRQIDATRTSAPRLRELLRNTAKLVLENVYYQSAPDVVGAFGTLADSAQLDIEVTQDILIESAFFYLPQLGLRSHPRLRDVFARWDAARYRNRELAHAARQEAQPTKTKDDEELLTLENELRDLLIEDEEVRAVVLEAVRRKIKAYQYDVKRALFELFQNADDACVELEAVSDRGQATDPVERLVVGCDRDRVYLVHWGRNINELARSDFAGERAGYGNDLRKMLVFQDSDKASDSTDGLTGKFGLGFKSTYLVSDSPEVYSGTLGFVVRGGVYPQRLPSETVARLKAVIQDEYPGGTRRGTIINLPLSTTMDVSAESVLEEFAKLAHIAPVFSRRIRSCVVRQDNTPRTVSWSSEGVLGLPGIATGSLSPLGEPEQRCLTFETCEHGVLLFLLDAHGVAALPSYVPTLWVTSPTREYLGVGFAINGAFDVDVGRTQFASQSDRNLAVATAIGKDAATKLQRFAQAALKDWPVMRRALRLADSTTDYDFWFTVWERVGVAVAGVSATAKASLLRALLWGHGEHPTGYGQLVCECAVLPTGLWGPHRVLTQYNKVRHVIEGMLGDPGVFRAVLEWPALRRLRPGELISNAVWKTVHELSVVPREPHALTLAEVVSWELGPDSTVEPSTARYLGPVINREFLAKLQPSRPAEHRELETLVRDARFRACDGSYHSAADLLVTSGDGREYEDQRLRATFAPESRVLSPDYVGDALRFVDACGKLEAPARTLAMWALGASSSEQRLGVLTYMLSGELSRSLAAELLPQVEGSWLREVSGITSSLMAAFSRNEWFMLTGLLGLAPDDYEQALVLPSQLPVDLLPTILEWWSANSASQLALYQRRTYPSGVPLSLSQDYDPSNLEHRRSWLTLFMLGSFYTMGRYIPEQHREFLDSCHRKGWLDVFAAKDATSDAWVEVLDQYTDEEFGVDSASYKQWMKQFVSIFRLARGLSDYVEIFLAMDELRTVVPLDQFTRSRESTVFQRGGIFAPSIDKDLGIGACFVVRELVRQGVVHSPYAYPHCFVPSGKIRGLFRYLGCQLDENAGSRNSAAIYRFLCERLGEKEATFGLSFDLPFICWLREHDG